MGSVPPCMTRLLGFLTLGFVRHFRKVDLFPLQPGIPPGDVDFDGHVQRQGVRHFLADECRLGLDRVSFHVEHQFVVNLDQHARRPTFGDGAMMDVDHGFLDQVRGTARC